MSDDSRPNWPPGGERVARTLDEHRGEARTGATTRGIAPPGKTSTTWSMPAPSREYGQLAVAAQRSRRDYLDLQSNTAGDGIITGTCTINAALVGAAAGRAAVIVNDYSVLAGTQGFFHHKNWIASAKSGRGTLAAGGNVHRRRRRRRNTDVTTQIAGLNIRSFSTWAGLSGKVPRDTVNNGYCFAGNAALFGCADFTIATRHSWIGMAGPAMIEGGGLGRFEPTDIGPVEVQEKRCGRYRGK